MDFSTVAKLCGHRMTHPLHFMVTCSMSMTHSSKTSSQTYLSNLN